METMTITVPGNAGELVYFTIKFAKERFSDVMETVEMLVKPSDVALAAEMGEFEIV